MKIVSGIISEMVKTVLNASMPMMPKTVNMQSMCGETQGTIWTFQPLDGVLNGLMSASILVSILQTIVSVSKTGPAATTSTVSLVSILTIISGVSLSRKMITVSSISLIQSLNMKNLPEKSSII